MTDNVTGLWCCQQPESAFFLCLQKWTLVDSKKLLGGFELEAFLVKDSLARLQPDYSDIKNTNIRHTVEPA